MLRLQEFAALLGRCMNTKLRKLNCRERKLKSYAISKETSTLTVKIQGDSMGPEVSWDTRVLWEQRGAELFLKLDNEDKTIDELVDKIRAQ